MNIVEPNHSLHVYEIARMFGSESNFNLKLMSSRSSINDLFLFEDFYSQLLNDSKITFFVSGDWISLVSELKGV
jgi:hypothetical protein